MRKRISKLILISSIAFNLAFIGFFAFHLFFGRRPPVMSKFDHAIRPYLEKSMPELRECHMEFRAKKRDFFLALIDEQFTEKDLRKKLNEIVEIQGEREKKIGMNLILLRKEVGIEKMTEILKKRRKREFNKRKNHQLHK